MSDKEKIPANTKNIYHVTKADFPLSCPMEDMVLYNSHPRVFFPLEELTVDGQAMCPYCGATYILDD